MGRLVFGPGEPGRFGLLFIWVQVEAVASKAEKRRRIAETATVCARVSTHTIPAFFPKSIMSNFGFGIFLVESSVGSIGRGVTENGKGYLPNC
jgi:hypothetical protein